MDPRLLHRPVLIHPVFHHHADPPYVILAPSRTDASLRNRERPNNAPKHEDKAASRCPYRAAQSGSVNTESAFPVCEW